MRIQKAKISDIEEILKIGKDVKEFKIFSDEVVSFWPKEILRNCIKSKNSFILVAKENKELAGFIVVNFNPTFNQAIIENIFVNKEFRRKNIGKELIKQSIEKLNKKKCGYLGLLTKYENKNTIKFNENIGFEKGEKCLWMNKILNKNFKS